MAQNLSPNHINVTVITQRFHIEKILFIEVVRLWLTNITPQNTVVSFSLSVYRFLVRVSTYKHIIRALSFLILSYKTCLSHWQLVLFSLDDTRMDRVLLENKSVSSKFEAVLDGFLFLQNASNEFLILLMSGGFL